MWWDILFLNDKFIDSFVIIINLEYETKISKQYQYKGSIK